MPQTRPTARERAQRNQCVKLRAGAVGPSSPLLRGSMAVSIETLPGHRLSLTVTSHRENDLAILELAGSLTLGPTLQTVREAVRQLLSTNLVAGILLDLAGVTAVDSAGLGELTARPIQWPRNGSVRFVWSG